MEKHCFHKSNPDIILDTDSEYSRIWIRKINKSSKQIYTLEADQKVMNQYQQTTGLYTVTI